MPRSINARRLRRSAAALITTLSLATATAACGAGGTSSSDQPSIVAGFYPLQYLAERLSGEEVGNLTSPGAEPHDLELTVRQVATIANADLVLTEKGMQPAVDKAVAENNAGAGLDISDAVDLRETEDGVDPHFWMDPERYSAAASAIADRLKEIEPAQADAIDSRLQKLKGELAELDEEIKSTFASCTSKTLVISHEAFGYWDKYGLDIVPIVGLSPETEASPAKLDQIATQISRDDVPAVYGEDIVESKAAGTLASDLGVKLETLTTIESLGPDTEGEDYLSLMRKNLSAIASGNSCEVS